MDNKFDGIIFDLDGTLWDPSDVVYESWHHVLNLIDDVTYVPTQKEMESVFGLTNDEIADKLFSYLPLERALEIFNECSDYQNTLIARKGGKTYPGVNDMLSELSKNHKLCIVSNCNKGYISAYFAGMGTGEYFSDIESFGRTGKCKAENIKDVVKRNGFTNPIYVGDTIWDKNSAESVGVPFIFASYGFGDIPDAKRVIRKPMELLDIIK